MGAVADAGGGLANIVQEGISGVGGAINRGGKSLGTQGIERPELAPIQSGTSVQDVQNAQSQAQQALASQQALLQALQGQGGLGMQSQAANQQQALANALAGANGVGTQQSAIQGLQGAAGQYADIAAGRGPNPAAAAYRNATGQNVANQAALMAGQRGAGANTGLLARQAAQQGAATQQQAVGQLAQLQAQQQIAGLQGYTGAQQALGGMGQNLVAQQAGAQNAYASQANQLAGQQLNANNAYMQNQLANQQAMQNSLSGVNQANVANQSSVNQGASAMGVQQAKGQQGIIGGLFKGAGAAVGAAAHGGMIQHLAEGGTAQQGQFDPNAPTSSFSKFLSGYGVNVGNNLGEVGDQQLNDGAADFAAGIKKQLMAPDELEVGEGQAVETPQAPMNPVQSPDAPIGPAGMAPTMAVAAKGGLAKAGGHVDAKNPAQKAVKSGDDYANDKVPTMLSEKEIVIPRSITMGENPVEESAKFVAKIVNEKGMAEGGKVEADEEEEEDLPDQEVADVEVADKEIPTLAPTAAPAPVAQGPSVTPPQSAPTAPMQPTAPTAPTQPAAAAPSAPNAVTPRPEEQSKEFNPKLDHQRMMGDVLNFGSDLRFQKIKPKTYSDLWGEKSTPGKIGTLVGLMFAGAGSGLIGGENVVLQMMDKQIERDIEAQKANQENKQSWFTLSMQNAMNQPEIQKRMEETKGIREENLRKKYENDTLGIARLEADATTFGYETMGLLNSMQDMVSRMPDGPVKDQHRFTLDNEVFPKAIKAIEDRFAAAAEKKALLMATSPVPKSKPKPPPSKGYAVPGEYYDAVNQNKLNEMAQRGKILPNAPNAIPPSQLGAVQEEQKRLDQHRKVYANAQKVFEILSQKDNAGQLPAAKLASGIASGAGALLGSLGGPGVGTAIGGTLGHLGGNKVGESIAHIYERERNILVDQLVGTLDPNKSFEERKRIAESMLPAWNDDSKTITQAHKELYRQFSASPAESTPLLDQYGLKYKLPEYEFKAPKKKEEKTEEKKPESRSREKARP